MLVQKNLRLVAIVLTILVLIAGGIGGWLLFSNRPVAYAPVGPGNTYLALGDSLAWGFRLADPDTESYPALLHARLQAADQTRTLVNISVPGATSSALRRQQLPRAISLIERERAAGRRVSPITIDIGGNDLRAAESADTARRDAAVAAVGANLSAILDALREATAGDADIVVMAYYNPYGGDANVPTSEAAWVMKLNNAIRAAAEPRGVAVADTYTPFEGGRAYALTNIVVGDIHANRQGHLVMADAFWSALQYAKP